MTGGLRRFAAVFCLVVFVAITLGAGAFDLMRPAPVPYLRGLERREDMRMRESAKVEDGTRARLIDRDVGLRSNLRHHVTPWYTGALVSGLREGNSGVVVGSDGWLFIEERLTPGDLDTRRNLQLSANLMASIARRLAGNGVDIALVPLPRKSVVAQEFLPAGVDPRASFDRSFVRELRRRGIPTADVLAAWEWKPAEEVYYQLDSHWTRPGMRYVAQAVCEVAGWQPPEERTTVVKEERDTTHVRTSLLETMGLRRGHAAREWFFEVDPVPGRFVYRADGRRRFKAPTDEEGAESLAVGTSFTRGDLFVEYLCHESGLSFVNMGARGEPPLAQLARALFDRREGNWPRELVFEYPIYYLFTGSGLGRSRQVPPAPSALLTLPLAERSFNVPGLTPKANRFGDAQRITLNWNRLASRGDGAYLLRIRGELNKPNGRLSYVARGIELRQAWRKKTREMVIPIVHLPGNPGAVTCMLRGIEIESVELVTDFDLEGGVPLDPGPARDGRQELTAADPITITSHSALWCQVGDDAPERTALELELLPEGEGEPQNLGRFEVVRGGTLLVTLGDVEGEWRGVRVRASEPTSSLIQSSKIVTLP